VCGLGTDQCRRVFKALKSLSLQTPACPEPPWSAGTFGRCPLPPSALEETQTRPARARARVPPVCCSVQVAADMELVGGVKKKDNWGDLHSGMQQGACARASPRCTCSRSVAEMARARLPWRLLHKRSVGGEEWSLTVEAARKVRKGPGSWPAFRFYAACCHEIRKI